MIDHFRKFGVAVVHKVSQEVSVGTATGRVSIVSAGLKLVLDIIVIANKTEVDAICAVLKQQSKLQTRTAFKCVGSELSDGESDVNVRSSKGLW